MAGIQTNNLQIVDETDFLPRNVDPTDTIVLTAEFEIQNDLRVTGNFFVAGSHSKIDIENLNVADNHIYLNDGYTTNTAQTAGLVANYFPTATADSVNGAFTAGVAATSNPTVITTGSATFSAADLIQIAGANESANDGLYEVLSHIGTTLTVRGVGTTSTVEDFTQTQFTSDTTAAGTITKVNVSVIRAGTDGVWETGLGSATPISFTDLGTGSGNTLQQAYVQGNQITTSAGEGDVIVAGTEQLLITATGGIDIDTQLDFDGTIFDVQMAGSNGFSIDGTAASNVTVNSGNLTLSTTTTGNVVVNSVADVDMDAVNILADATAGISLDAALASNFTVTANDAGDQNLSIGVTNAGAGAGNLLLSAGDELDLTSTGLMDVNAGANLDIDVTGTYDMLATGAFSIDGTGASNVTATSGDLTVSTLTTGNVVVNSVADVDIDGVNVFADATAGISLDAALASNFTVTANDGADQNLSIGVTNAGAGAGNLLLSAGDELDLTSTGLMDVNAGANLDIDVTGTYDMLATGAFSIDGTGASNVTAASGNLTVSTSGSGSLLLTSVGDSTYTIPSASATSFALTDGSATYINVDSTTGFKALDLDTHVNLVEGAGVEISTNSSTSLVAGDLVAIDQDGNLKLAAANSGTLTDGLVVGVSRGTFGTSTSSQIFTVHGSVVPIRFTSAPLATDNGKQVFLSATAGQAALSPPGTPSNRVIYLIGYLQGGDGSSTTVDVLFSPQYISKGPSVS